VRMCVRHFATACMRIAVRDDSDVCGFNAMIIVSMLHLSNYLFIEGRLVHVVNSY